MSAKVCHKLAEIPSQKLIVTASKIENLLPILASHKDRKRRTLVLSGLADLDLTLNVEED